MNKVIYKQFDSRWGSKPYPTKSSSFAGNGCGCCACTHLVIEQNKYKNYTPENLRPWMVKQGFAAPNQGTSWNGIKLTLEHYGYKVVHIGINDPMSKAWAELNKGDRIGVILFLGGSGPDGTVWTAGGHYVAFTDYKIKNNKHYFYTKDSGGRNHDGWYTYENSMKGLVYQMWIVKKIDVKSTSEPKTTNTVAPKQNVVLDVNGKFDKTSVKMAQKLFGTVQDGIISGQLAKLKQYHKGFDGNIKYGVGGSAFVKALQKYLELDNPDGQLGFNTISALQRFLGIAIDGVWGAQTSKAFQKWLNNNKTLPAKKKLEPKIKIKGMDISTWQGKRSVADFKKAKEYGIKFVILRVGFTGSESNKPTLDNTFENNYKNAIAAGLPVGIYYYSLATTEAKAKEEANFCIKQLKGKKITYPVYIDMEDLNKQAKQSKATLASVCDTFCKAIKKAGYIPGVYANVSWFNTKIGNITAPHTKWVAQYYTKCEYKGAYDMWQYSSSESVPGIDSETDVNWCYKKF